MTLSAALRIVERRLDRGRRHPRACAMAPYPRHRGSWTHPVEVSYPPEDRPVGRRALLGMLGLGVAGVLWGAKVQTGWRRCSARSPSRTAPASPACSRPPVASASTRSPARCRSRSDAEYRLTVDGSVDRPAVLDLTDLRERLPQTSLTRDFQCVTGLAGRGRALAGREAGRPARRGGRPALGDPRALLVLRRRLHRDAHDRPGPPRRRAHRPPHAGPAGHPGARRAGAPLRGSDVRLQVDQVARAHRGRRRPRRPHRPRLLGAPRLRRRRVGGHVERPQRRPVRHDASRQRQRSASVERPGRPLLAGRALAALDQRDAVPRAARHGDDPLPAVPVGARRPTGAGEGHPRVQRAAAAGAAARRLRRVAGATACAATCAGSRAGPPTTGDGC